jgi:Family of unknown function (DUF6504)
MRCYDDPIIVRRGLVAGQEAPEQFLWRDRLWVVRDIVSHWVETGPWWEQPGVAALLGVDHVSADGAGSGVTDGLHPDASLGVCSGVADSQYPGASLGASPRAAVGSALSRGGVDAAGLLGEREVWRVEAARGGAGCGVFDLAFDWADGYWSLVRSID